MVACVSRSAAPFFVDQVRRSGYILWYVPPPLFEPFGKLSTRLWRIER